jgi:hypothetical protein
MLNFYAHFGPFASLSLNVKIDNKSEFGQFSDHRYLNVYTFVDPSLIWVEIIIFFNENETQVIIFSYQRCSVSVHILDPLLISFEMIKILNENETRIVKFSYHRYLIFMHISEHLTV